MKANKPQEGAATAWFKWNKDDLLGPALYEWCLWTMIINGQRNYFSGSLVEVGEGKVFLQWDGFTGFTPDDSVYWARVNTLPADSQHENPQEGAGVRK